MEELELIFCVIEWQDDRTQQEVIIKTNNEVIEEEDDEIFFYGLSLKEIKDCIANGIICENKWKILEIL